MKNIDRLQEYGQEHLLRFFDELNEDEKKSLIDQINEVDFTLLDALKNKDQNNRLSFKLADKSHTFIHMNKMHGSHVIIFKDDIDNDVLLVGLEIALVLSGQEDGEIQVAKVKDIKKGHEVGQVLLDKYQTYNLKEVRDSTKELLKSQRRF